MECKQVNQPTGNRLINTEKQLMVAIERGWGKDKVSGVDKEVQISPSKKKFYPII